MNAWEYIYLVVVYRGKAETDRQSPCTFALDHPTMSGYLVSDRVVPTSQGGGLAPEGLDIVGSSKATITKVISMIPRVGMGGGKVLPVHNNTHHYYITTNLPLSLHTNLPTISVAVSMSRSGRRATETESKP